MMVQLHDIFENEEEDQANLLYTLSQLMLARSHLLSEESLNNGISDHLYQSWESFVNPEVKSPRIMHMIASYKIIYSKLTV